jgi:hypothetical protein
MSNNNKKSDSPIDSLTSDAARQRWQMFHRAIAHAKESNNASLIDNEGHGGETENPSPLLSVIR